MLEDSFDLLTPDDIRLKGSRIGIETVFHEHVYRLRIYRLRNQQNVDRYLARWLEFRRTSRAEQGGRPPPVAAR